MNKIFFEDLNNSFGYYYREGEVLLETQSKFQKVELVETDSFGKCLKLDGITQVGEKGEAYYHEPMTHFPMTMHKNPKDVLVIGGGDGGIVREVLKHKTVKSVHHVDIDGEVVKFCEEHLPSISQGCWDNKKTKLVIGDGRQYVEEHQGKFDVVIMDMTDPSGPSTALYTREFFKAVKRSFKKPNKGYFSMHSESPLMRPEAYTSILKTLEEVFEHVVPHYLYIQMYGTLWSLAVCGDGSSAKKLSGKKFNARLASQKIKNLKVVTGDSFKAMQVIYPEIAQLKRNKAKIITDQDSTFPDELARVCYYDPAIQK